MGWDRHFFDELTEHPDGRPEMLSKEGGEGVGVVQAKNWPPKEPEVFHWPKRLFIM